MAATAWISCLLHEADQGGTAVVAKKGRPFFTCHGPREGIEGVLPDKGSGLPSPNQSPSIGINKGIKHPDSCRGRSSRGGSGRPPAIPPEARGPSTRPRFTVSR